MYVQQFIAIVSEKVRIVNKGGLLLFFHSNISLFYLTCVICKRLSVFFWLIFFHYYIIELIILVLPLFYSFFFFLCLFCLVCGIRCGKGTIPGTDPAIFFLYLYFTVFLLLLSAGSVTLHFKAFLCVHMTQLATWQFSPWNYLVPVLKSKAVKSSTKILSINQTVNNKIVVMYFNREEFFHRKLQFMS